MRHLLAIAALAACAVAIGAVPAGAATDAQYRAKCKAAWTGSTTTAAYRKYRARCVNASKAAVSEAEDAGNPTSTAANKARARTACGAQYPAPRNTAAKRKAYNACVTAATGAQRSYAGRPLKATLLGANETPPTGSGSGTANIRLNQGKGRVCWTITLTGLSSAVTGAHIHTGAAGVDGGVVVALGPNIAEGCADNVDPQLIKDIRQSPAQYYVNVHTATFGNGEVRGQLRK